MTSIGNKFPNISFAGENAVTINPTTLVHNHRSLFKATFHDNGPKKFSACERFNIKLRFAKDRDVKLIR